MTKTDVIHTVLAPWLPNQDPELSHAAAVHQTNPSLSAGPRLGESCRAPIQAVAGDLVGAYPRPKWVWVKQQSGTAGMLTSFAVRRKTDTTNARDAVQVRQKQGMEDG